MPLYIPSAQSTNITGLVSLPNARCIPLFTYFTISFYLAEIAHGFHTRPLLIICFYVSNILEIEFLEHKLVGIFDGGRYQTLEMSK